MSLKITLIALFFSAITSAQNFTEVQLPTPDKLSPLFIGSLSKSTIHYGATPPNFNGKVILFNHGYLDLNQGQFLFDNSFYRDTYRDGYQAVFVATTRGGGIWVNGQLLAESIDIITSRFHVAQVYLVGHSNGGKASEAAMIQYGKKNKVALAFGLGTPYWGTYLADISQLPWLNWAWRLTGLNEGAYTSTTYYCRDVIRPYLDRHANNQPEKFVVLGASGFYHGSHILAAPAFLVTGGILFPAQGANDGVAPYSSTLRPGAEYVFEKNDSRAIFDHLDVGMGQFSWSYVKQYIENNSPVHKLISKAKKLNRTKIESDYYIIHSDNEYEEINLDDNSTSAIAEIIHEDEFTTFQILNKNNKQATSYKNIAKENHKTTISFSESGLRLKSKSRYAAFIKQNNGIKMSFENIKKGKHPSLKVHITVTNKNANLLASGQVRAVISRNAHIDGTPIESETEIINFTPINGNFYFDTKNLKDGIYSIFINSESKNNYKRSIISGFVIGDVKENLSAFQNKKILQPEKQVSLYPNAVKDQAYLHINEHFNNPEYIEISIFDITGKKIKDFKIKTNQTHNHNISNHIKSLKGGIYLLKAGSQSTIKFIKE